MNVQQELRPVAKNTLVSQAAESIRAYIVNGGFKAGDKLPSEKNLGSSLSVSRTVLREALRSLEAIGMIYVRDGAGAYVSEVNAKTIAKHLSPLFEMSSDSDIEHMAQARAVVEVGAVPFIIQRYTRSDSDRLHKILEAFERAASVVELHKAEEEFHVALIEIAGNPLLTEFSSFLVRFFSIGRQYISWKEVSIEDTVEDHRQLLDVIESGDITAAQKAMSCHILEWSRQPNIKVNG